MSHYVEELNEVSDILEAQVSAGMCRDEVLEALFSTWLEKITSIKDKMKATVITALSSSIKGTPFSTDQKKTLARAVLNIGATKKKTVHRRSNQKCHNLENFIPEDKWVLMKRTGVSINTRLSVLAQVCASMRLVNPDQPTLFRGVAIAAHCSQDHDASQTKVHKDMDALQIMVKLHPENNELEYLSNFPASACDLPAAHQSALGTPLPVDVDIPDLSTILAGNKMRGRKSKTAADPQWITSILNQVPDRSQHDAIRQQLLANVGAAGASAAAAGDRYPVKQESVSGLQSVKRELPADTIPQAPPAQMAGLAPILRFAAPSKKGGKKNEASVSSLLKLEDDLYDRMKTARSAKRKKRKQEQDEAYDEEEEDDDADEDEKGEEEDDFEDDPVVEPKMAKTGGVLRRPAAARKDMRAVKAMKRPRKKPASAAGKAAAKKAMKRPAAAGKSAAKTAPKKKPAAASLNLKTATWKNIHSKIWHRVRDSVFRKTNDMQKAKDEASAACQRAKPKFLNGTLKL